MKHSEISLRPRPGCCVAVGYVIQSVLVATTFVVSILMLNALIAIMGDTYDRVSADRLERGLQGRAILLAEIEGAMTEAELQNASLFPRWLHGIRRDNDEAVEETEWSGRLRALKNAVTKVATDVTKVATELVSVEPNVSKKVQAVRDELTQKIDGIESKIVATEAAIVATEAAIDAKVGAIEAKLDKIMELLGAAAAGPSAPQAAAIDSADEGAADDPNKTPRSGKKGVIRKMSSK